MGIAMISCQKQTSQVVEAEDKILLLKQVASINIYQTTIDLFHFLIPYENEAFWSDRMTDLSFIESYTPMTKTSISQKHPEILKML